MLSSSDGIVAVQDSLPEPVLDALLLLTHLGDPLFLGVLVVGFYFLTRDEHGVFTVGVSVGAVALTTTLKGLFASNRPPNELSLVSETGFSFPSGHAVGVTVVFLLLAELLDFGTRPVRYSVAVIVIGVVAMSRVALGVHYPIDVVSGAVVGGIYLLLVTWDGRDPEVAFSAALTVAVVGVALGSGYRIPVSVGLPIGGYVGWHLIGEKYELSDVAEKPEAVLLVLLPTVALALIAPAGTDVLVQTVGYGVGTGAVVVSPQLVDRLKQGNGLPYV